MGLIQQLTPNNLLQEKERFFSDESYNPQFTYDEAASFSTSASNLAVQPKLVELAQSIAEKAYHNRTENELRELEGPIITEAEVDRKVRLFIDAHNLSTTLDHVWSVSFLSRASMFRHTLKLKSGLEYRDLDTIGMIYHELGTHALRRLNYEQQPWFKKKKKFGFSDYLPTEEGLAVIHALLPKQMQLAYTAATRYLACVYAQEHSFAEVWEFLKKYLDNPETRWMVAVRQKRGLTDTSQPGGYSKDLVYLQGFAEVLEWLRTNDFRLEELYYGKMSIVDTKLAAELNPDYQPILPQFYQSNRHKYVERINKIIETNYQ